MKLKKDINRLIIAKVIEIIFICVFLVVIAPLRKNMENIASMALLSPTPEDKLSYTTLAIGDIPTNSIIPIDDNKALTDIKDTILTVKNDSLIKENYILLLSISKKSSLDYNVLNIAIDNKVKKLNQLVMEEDNNNYHFILDENALEGDSKEYKVKLWLDNSVGNEMHGKSLILDYEIAKSVTEL